jgi:hypothetical protein
MTLVFSQAAPFSGAAYQYRRAGDALPSFRRIANEPDPLCRVKLFQPGSRWIYYVCAASEYEGVEAPVLTGFCVSPLGPHCDELGDQPLAEITRVRVAGLPPERDLYFEPVRLSRVEAHVARHGYRGIGGLCSGARKGSAGLQGLRRSQHVKPLAKQSGRAPCLRGWQQPQGDGGSRIAREKGARSGHNPPARDDHL